LRDERKPDFESDGVHEIDLDWSSPSEIQHPAAARHAAVPAGGAAAAVARESSVTLVNEAVKERKVIGVLTQRDPAVDEPLESDLYPIGTLTHIHKMFRFPDGSLRLVVQGLQRFRILQVSQYRPYLKARVELIKETVPADQEVEVKALAQSALSFFQRVVELSPTLSDELATVAGNLQKPEHSRPHRRQSADAQHSQAGVPETIDARADRARQQVRCQGPRGAEARRQIQSQVKASCRRTSASTAPRER
jgi:ATP-dependent Lon protease